jgi:hypothetical protein
MKKRRIQTHLEEWGKSERAFQQSYYRILAPDNIQRLYIGALTSKSATFHTWLHNRITQ